MENNFVQYQEMRSTTPIKIGQYIKESNNYVQRKIYLIIEKNSLHEGNMLVGFISILPFSNFLLR